MICDNDNVSPFGTNLGIMGKQRWMAPEIVTGQNDPDKKINKVGQDASGELFWNDVTIIAVADGHGSDNYIRTDRGSKFAVHAALDAIQAFIVDARGCGIAFMDNSDDCLAQISKNIFCSLFHDILKPNIERN